VNERKSINNHSPLPSITPPSFHYFEARKRGPIKSQAKSLVQKLPGDTSWLGGIQLCLWDNICGPKIERVSGFLSRRKKGCSQTRIQPEITLLLAPPTSLTLPSVLVCMNVGLGRKGNHNRLPHAVHCKAHSLWGNRSKFRIATNLCS
jgi:hypothetical protein